MSQSTEPDEREEIAALANELFRHTGSFGVSAERQIYNDETSLVCLDFVASNSVADKLVALSNLKCEDGEPKLDHFMKQIFDAPGSYMRDYGRRRAGKLKLEDIRFTPERKIVTTHDSFLPGLKGYVKAANGYGIEAEEYVHANSWMPPDEPDEEILQFLEDVGELQRFKEKIHRNLQQQIDALARFATKETE